MNRREGLNAAWATAAGLGLSSLLGACGFRLRGEQAFAFDTISVLAAQNGPVAADLRGRRTRWARPRLEARSGVVKEHAP